MSRLQEYAAINRGSLSARLGITQMIFRPRFPTFVETKTDEEMCSRDE